MRLRLAEGPTRDSVLPRWLHYAALIPLSALYIAANMNSAQAQLIEQYVPDDLPGYVPDFSASVLNRIYYQQEPEGVQVGDYVIRPALTENTGYNSNTLGNANSGSSELESTPSLRVDSDWSRNSLSFSFNADNRQYFEVPSASYTNWKAGAAGSLDLGNDKLKISYIHSALNIAATDLGLVGITTPVPYSVDDANIAYMKEFSRFSLTPTFEFENFTFGQSTGTTNINYSGLNHHTELESLAGRYEATPGNAAVLVVRLTQAQFQNLKADNFTDAGGFAGLDFRGDTILQLRALLGVEHRNFSSNSEKPITLPSFQFSALWAPTELNTVTATATRRIDDPTSPFALDATIVEGNLAVYHELRSNIFVTGSADIEHSKPEFGNSYLNNDAQTGVNLALNLIWDISTHITGTIGYAYNDTSSQNSSTALAGGYPNFNSHTILIGITLYE